MGIDATVIPVEVDLSASVDNSTIEYVATLLRIKALGVTTAKMAAEAIHQIKSIAPAAFNTASVVFVDVTGMSVTITTTGNPVLILWNTGLSAGDTAGRVGRFTILRDAVNLGSADYGLGMFVGDGYSASGMLIETPAAGTYVYKGQLRTGGAGTIYMSQATNPAKLIVMEIKK
jgi:hypothetical protein